MSDTFDHEGDAWDSYEFRDADDHNSEYAARHPGQPLRCHRCGSMAVAWGVNHNGKWQLFSTYRGEHNRKVPHVCNPVTADDFDDLT